MAIFSSIAAGALANLLSDGVKSGLSAWRSTPDVEDNSAVGRVLTSAAGDRVILTPQQERNLNEFLREPSVLGLATGLVIATPALLEGRDEVAGDLKIAFGELARQACSTTERSWYDAWEIVWEKLVAYVAATLPAPEVLAKMSANEYESLVDAPDAEFLSAHESALPAFVRDILAISRDAGRLTKSRQLVSDLRRLSTDAYSEMWLQHLYDDRRFQYEHLYVNRTLKSTESSEVKSQEILADTQEAYRAVVIGDPGVGKSTLVRRLIFKIATEDSLGRAPILVRVRELKVTARTSLVDDASKLVSSQLALDFGGDDLSDLLTLGKAIVVFDGIDEISDISTRRLLIRRIEAFARRFPLTQIIATSRRVGYVRAKFDESMFEVYELSPYTGGQVAEYVTRWFGLAGQPAEDAEAFLRESRPIEDVRTNPLMLSLLCTLYRARGYLPTNRRTVYGECASLLFTRWDSMRHIRQPYAHRQYGEQLMQELAYFFYKTTSASGGVDEVVLVKLIAGFFCDTAGVEPEDAKVRAQEFVDFCADRAWLLSAKGTSHRDMRVFAFTHQTFLEYFAAEAVVRKSSSRTEAISAVISAHKRSPGSLICDLMIQSAEYKYEHAAEELIANLLATRRSEARTLTLCLRVANATPLKAATLDKVYDRLLDDWAKDDPDRAYSELLAILEMYRDPMNRFRSAIGLDSWRAGEGLSRHLVNFSVRYARLSLLNESSVFDADWVGVVNDVLRASPKTWGDPAVAHFLSLASGSLESFGLQDTRGGLALAISAFDRAVLGAPLQLLDNAARGETGPDPSDMLEWLAEERIPFLEIPHALATVILRATNQTVSNWRAASAFDWHNLGRPRHVRDILIWLRCLLAEATFDVPHTLATRDDLLIDQRWFEGVAQRRRDLYSRGEADQALDFITAHLIDPPYWFGAWAIGNYKILPRIDESAQPRASGLVNRGHVVSASPERPSRD